MHLSIFPVIIFDVIGCFYLMTLSDFLFSLFVVGVLIPFLLDDIVQPPPPIVHPLPLMTSVDECCVCTDHGLSVRCDGSISRGAGHNEQSDVRQ